MAVGCWLEDNLVDCWLEVNLVDCWRLAEVSLLGGRSCWRRCEAASPEDTTIAHLQCDDGGGICGLPGWPPRLPRRLPPADGGASCAAARRRSAPGRWQGVVGTLVWRFGVTP